MTAEENRRNARKAQRRIDGLLRRAMILLDRVNAVAVWTEDNVEAPGAVSNLMSAQGHARELVECLALEASPALAEKALG